MADVCSKVVILLFLVTTIVCEGLYLVLDMADVCSKVVILLFLVTTIVCEGLCLVLALF